MTFSIAGRCRDTGNLGVAISSSSIAVGARCPWMRAQIGAVATQNVTLPSLGRLILDGLEADRMAKPETAMEQALATDPYSRYRQVIVIDSKGRSAVFTGSQALGTSNAAIGEQCVAAGNLLMTPRVIASMIEAFVAANGHLADRLLSAMHAAVAAGGEAGPVHSAAMKIVGHVDWPIVDLRVDWTESDPIEALDNLWQAYRPQMHDYLTRALDPTAAPSYNVPGDE